MAQIEVNHQSLREAATAVTDYCDEQDREMNKAKEAVRDMMEGFKGEDATAFQERWDALNAPESSTIKFRDSLKNYASALSSASEIYRAAQEKIYNEANWLPKYLYW